MLHRSPGNAMPCRPLSPLPSRCRSSPPARCNRRSWRPTTRVTAWMRCLPLADCILLIYVRVRPRASAAASGRSAGPRRPARSPCWRSASPLHLGVTARRRASAATSATRRDGGGRSIPAAAAVAVPIHWRPQREAARLKGEIAHMPKRADLLRQGVQRLAAVRAGDHRRRLHVRLLRRPRPRRANSPWATSARRRKPASTTSAR